jgi:UDP-glucose 4-epimerase
MNILVIGGAGYIGSHVVRTLLDNGHRVAVYDNLSTGTTDNLVPEAAFIKGDILDYDALCQAMRQGFDGCIHMAAFKAAGESMLVPEKYSVNNVTGSINILNAMCACGVRQLVFSSTAAVYGEPQYLPMDERHPTGPTNYYGFTKLTIEGIFSWYAKLKGLRFAVLRYFNAVGYDVQGRVMGLENNPANLLPIVMEVAVGVRPRVEIFGDDYDTRDGTGVRDYVHVNDLADAHVRSLDYLQKSQRSLLVNLGTEQGFTVKEMVEAARRITGKPIPAVISPRRAGDPGTIIASSGQARALLGWEARSSDLDTIVASTWAVYKQKFAISG